MVPEHYIDALVFSHVFGFALSQIFSILRHCLQPGGFSRRAVGHVRQRPCLLD
jgi:hypothetical protein